MSAQSDEVPKSMIEFIYRDVLRDVNALVKSVEGIKESVPTAAHAAARQLAEQTNSLVRASGQIQKDLERLAREVDAITDKTAKNAMASLKDDIGGMAKDAILASLNEGDASQKISAAVAEITQAANALSGQARETNARIDKASKQVSWGVYKLAAVVAGASLATALVGGFVVRASAQPAAALSPADAKALVDGRALAKAWPSLTARERERITELSK